MSHARPSLLSLGFIAVLFAAVGLWLGGFAVRAETERPAGVARGGGASAEPPIRGVVISCQTWGHEWGSDAMLTALDEVKALGANWVQIHPYGRIDRAGNVSFGRMPRDGSTPEWLSRPIREAHARGLKIAIVPHVAGWGAGWNWRGDIVFDDPGEWTRFFASYQTWITTMARMCRDADGFSVGSELDRTIAGHEAEWRGIIRTVRAETTAALTYGANWPDYRAVPFWDALDAIGISAYFPLVEHGRAPIAGELDAAWKRLHGELADYARAQNRRVVFMELGYDASMEAAREPWVSGPRGAGADAEAVQTLCLDRALAAANADPNLAGLFLWKWFPGEARRADFRVQSPPMRAVLGERWAGAGP
ncbi:MAG: hypothetical protein H7067_14135 [Burkholderiales bacterium]|nr:hypothetical protein [Opitutaceae bacterium]